MSMTSCRIFQVISIINKYLKKVLLAKVLSSIIGKCRVEYLIQILKSILQQLASTVSHCVRQLLWYGQNEFINNLIIGNF